jgi:SAM-dependent methyltransferase
LPGAVDERPGHAAGGSAAATETSSDVVVPALDPARVLADRDACGALEELAGRLRLIGYRGDGPHDGAASPPDQMPVDAEARTLVDLARGERLPEDAALDALGTDAWDAFERCGALHVAAGEVCLAGRVVAMRSVYSLLPTNPAGVDLVYLGPDSIVLFQRVWSARGHGGRAADLATGNGFIAAALATRYDHVVAADISGRCAATAALVAVLNPHLRGRFTAMQMDIAQGLRHGSFDLVTANAPWVPETVAPDGGPPRLFAAGGPTGCELPLQFVDQAAQLLAPGGRAFVACLDVTFGDGRRPVAEHLPAVAASGFEVTSTASPLNDVFDYNTWVAAKAPGAVAADHVVVEVHRPPRNRTDRRATPGVSP